MVHFARQVKTNEVIQTFATNISMSGKKRTNSKTRQPKGGGSSSASTTTTSNKSNSKDSSSVGNNYDQKSGSNAAAVAAGSSSKTNNSNNNTTTDIPSAGYLVKCDIPTKQYIQYLNELKPPDKKFIILDLDATHLLVEHKARDEIERKVEEWLDENIFSAVEKVGEDFDMS